MPALRARFAILAVAVIAGCVTVDGKLEGDGSGTVQLAYPTPVQATEESERRRFTSEHVKVESLTIAGGSTTARVRVDDVGKLSSASAFENVTVTRGQEDGAEKLTLVLKNPQPIDIKNDKPPGPTFTITLPARVLDANRGATVAGERVTWTFGSLRDYARQASVDLVARYAAASAPPATAPATGRGK